jgi:hypothetical protein
MTKAHGNLLVEPIRKVSRVSIVNPGDQKRVDDYRDRYQSGEPIFDSRDPNGREPHDTSGNAQRFITGIKDPGRNRLRNQKSTY